jgi:hypothetical protein
MPIPGEIPFGAPLATTLARRAVTIDVLNPGYVHGYGHKPILGFAAGGLVLLNRKRDFLEAFGEAGEAVSYGGADDLAGKVDRFLGDPRYRREVMAAIRETIAARYQLRDVLLRVLEAAWRCVERIGALERRARPDPGEKPPAVVMNLLRRICCEGHWIGASVQQVDGAVVIETAPQPWAYAARVAIPDMTAAMNEPLLRLRVAVQAGRIGIAALCEETGALVNEQLISPASNPVALAVELPREGVRTVILRNAAETASRALLLEAELCERPA